MTEMIMGTVCSPSVVPQPAYKKKYDSCWFHVVIEDQNGEL
jgi:hypothetical protein